MFYLQIEYIQKIQNIQMPLDLVGEIVVLVCVDDTIVIQKDKLRIFNYFNKIFQDHPDIKEVKLDEKRDDLVPVLTFLSDNTKVDKDNIELIAHYFVKWDPIVKDRKPYSHMLDYINDVVYFKQENPFEYSCEWLISLLHTIQERISGQYLI